MAFNVQKEARRRGNTVVAATTHTDLLEDLAPSVHIHKGWGKRLEVKYYPNQLRKVCSVTRCLKIEEGSLKDYKRLAAFHYRNPDTHPVPLKIFVLRRGDGEAVGVVFYSWRPLNTSGRKKALGYRVPVKELNRQFATIARVILHPKYRSVGLGAKLVKETLPLVGRRYVETMAVMAKYNPFFEKAGMTRITMRKPAKSVCQAVDKLEELGFKPPYWPVTNQIFNI